MPRSTETAVKIESAAETVFAYLDDHRHLGAHMSASSWMMLGSKMDYEFDAGEARSVGSKFGFHGKILGIALSAEQAIVIRVPPRLKVWQTIGAPNLWVIGRYRMGFEIVPEVGSYQLRVFIDYDLPETAPARWLGLISADVYARWCTGRMAKDAAGYFGKTGAQAIPSTG
ncbi:SRPBCC family protein [Mesorhizobium sp. M9A.F.Ca.ET.002.03.1.2]|uniref:SRPBCC family protein n=1 Tax=Mesorhizobium sp. M9A.F.Ca.ET.002.03.1.2 TaxID=2493668 RepID=UPI000F759067|nr:SRPBCC family protein [Mesorhizobium sp. M9A.F.Ca.ET.002.03.1.2]AZN98884.1 SRPBCC family protein [Mesorhizobium sp. M9A.F.Ca.ET.002.03.1.2]